MLFCSPVAPFGFSPFAIQNRHQGVDSAHFEKHWCRLSVLFLENKHENLCMQIRLAITLYSI